MSSRIERTITVNWRHQVLFTQNVFDTENPTLRDALVDGEKREPRKTLIVVDEALAKANTPQNSPQNGVNRELFDAQLQKLRDQVQNLAEYLERADSAE